MNRNQKDPILKGCSLFDPTGFGMYRPEVRHADWHMIQDNLACLSVHETSAWWYRPVDESIMNDLNGIRCGDGVYLGETEKEAYETIEMLRELGEK